MSATVRAALAITFAAAVALALSPFLPWAKGDAVVASFTETGIDAGWGWVTVGAAALAAVIAIAAARGGLERPAWLLLAVLAIVAGAVTAYEFTAVRSSLRDAHSQATFSFGEGLSVDALTTSYGVGLYLAAAGSGLLFIAALVWRTAVRRERQPTV
jgi:hypothetical protein